MRRFVYLCFLFLGECLNAHAKLPDLFKPVEAQGFHEVSEGVESPFFISWYQTVFSDDQTEARTRCEHTLKKIETQKKDFSKNTQNLDWAKWEPWDPEELKFIQNCKPDDCKIKLSDSEMKLLTQKKDRTPTVLTEILEKRIKQKKRQAYEFGLPTYEPLDIFQKLGFNFLTDHSEKKTAQKSELKSTLVFRILDLKEDNLKRVRQVLEKSYATLPKEKKVTIYTRDLYSAHFFETWGEWLEVDCSPSGGIPHLTYLVMLETDELRKGGLVKILAKEKIKQEFQKKLKSYQKNELENYLP